jgi:hypothetical protein
MVRRFNLSIIRLFLLRFSFVSCRFYFLFRFFIAEKDKETLENKPPASSEALESLNKQMEGLSLMLHSAHDTISNGELFLLVLHFSQIS